MIQIDSNVRSTFDFKFAPAISRTEHCAVYRMEETFCLDGEYGFKGDWLVREHGKLKLVKNRHFQGNYVTRDLQAKTERKRIPMVQAGDVADTQVIKVGAKGRTSIRKQVDSSVYIVDDTDNLVNREVTPYVFLTLHCPFTEPGVTSGAFVEDVIDILIDHLEGSRTKQNGPGVSEIQMILQTARLAIIRYGAGIVNVPEDKFPDMSDRGGQYRPLPRPCCGGDK